MRTRELREPPSLLGLYGRAVASMLPGASRLPIVPGGGGAMPRLTLTLEGAAIEPEALTAYREICGFAAGDSVPSTYPHILAFPLQMALMTDPGFPFGAVGLVHIENTIIQRRPLQPGERLTFEVSATEPSPHRRGQTFEILTLARAAGELVWEERSQMLRRESSASGRAEDEAPGDRTERTIDAAACSERFGECWQAPADIGRRYGALSGDRNPIHMSNLTARAFGFPRAIAHGMWSKARCLAALEPRLPGTYVVIVSFRKPVALPAQLAFTAAVGPAEETAFELRGTNGRELHLLGEVWQADAEVRA